ncbi:MAG: hypothetical protein ACRD3Q_05475 [Terriglobales bacterium]
MVEATTRPGEPSTQINTDSPALLEALGRTAGLARLGHHGSPFSYARSYGAPFAGSAPHDWSTLGGFMLPFTVVTRIVAAAKTGRRARR